jgi:hypothetical protein
MGLRILFKMVDRNNVGVFEGRMDTGFFFKSLLHVDESRPRWQRLLHCHYPPDIINRTVDVPA